jgi:hypothetical protein
MTKGIIQVFRLATGLAGAMVLASGSIAAELPASRASKANAEGLQICAAYGRGFFRIPGTETCLKIGLDISSETKLNFVNNDFSITTLRLPTFTTPTGGAPELVYSVQDLRGTVDRYRFITDTQFQVASATQTDYGPLFSFFSFRTPQITAAEQRVGLANNNIQLDQAWVKFGGLTSGLHKSYFDFTQTGYVHQGGYGSSRVLPLLAYTQTLSSMATATISIEDGTYRRYQDTILANYSGTRAPDVVGQLRVTPTWGVLHASVAYHSIRDQAANLCCGTAVRSSYGWAAQVGGEYRTKWSDVFGSFAGETYGRFMVSATAAHGAQDYLGIPFFAPDYIADEDGRVRKTRGASWLASYEHIWTPTLKSTFSYSAYRTQTVSGLTELAPGIPFNIDLRSRGALYQVGTEYMPVPDLMIGAKVDYFRDTLQSFTAGAARSKEGVEFVNTWFYIRRRV